MTPVRVGLLDSGVDDQLMVAVDAARGFEVEENGTVSICEATPDRLRHGSELARIIRSYAPEATFLVAQVFRQRASTAVEAVVAGLEWLSEEGACVVNMSFGLLRDCEGLRTACEKASQAGVIVVCSSPARGTNVYPASYGVGIRVTGDARCSPKEISWLATATADFGACPFAAGGRLGESGGASFAAAHVTGLVANYLAKGGATESVRRWLIVRASHFGPERRCAI